MTAYTLTTHFSYFVDESPFIDGSFLYYVVGLLINGENNAN